MARNNVVATPILKIERHERKKPEEYGKATIHTKKGNYEIQAYIGKYQKRFPFTVATSQRLLEFRKCIKGELKGRTFKNLGEVWSEFSKAAVDCSNKATQKYGPPRVKEKKESSGG